MVLLLLPQFWTPRILYIYANRKLSGTHLLLNPLLLPHWRIKSFKSFLFLYVAEVSV